MKVALAIALAFAAAPVAAQQVTAAEAARLAFPGCAVERERVTLTAGEREQLQRRAQVRAMPAVVVRFVARRDGEVAGIAYLDTRRVRSKAQQLLIVVDAAGKVRRIEVLAWKEPPRYRPNASFWAQFHGRKLDDDLRLRRGIRPITGATMSGRAAVDAVRTVLAVHERRPAK